MRVKEREEIVDKELDYNIENVYKDSGELTTDWKNIPRIDNLLDEVRAGETELNKQLHKITKWASYLNGDVMFETSKGRSRFVYKLTRKQLEWQYPSAEEPFLSSTRLFEFDDSIPMNPMAIMQLQNLTNYQFTKETDRVDFITRYIRKTINDGTSIIKVSWDREVVQEESVIEAVQYQEEDWDDILSQNPDGTLTVAKNQVVSNKPVFEFCDIENTIIDPSAKGNIKDARYVLHRFESTLSQLKEDGRYFNLHKLTIEDLVDSLVTDFASTTTLDYLATNDLHHVPNKPLIVNEYWGYYDIDNDGIVEPVIISWIGEIIVRMEENPYPLKELPFVIIQCLPDVDSNYGDSPIELLKDNQDVMSANIRGVIDITGKKAMGQRVTTKGAFDSINKVLFEQGEDCEINQGHSLKDSVYTQSFEELPQAVPYILNFFNNEAEALTGVKSFTEGITGSSMGDTATAVRSVMDSTSKRESSLLRRLASGISNLCYKVLRLNIELLSDEEIMTKSGFDEVYIQRTQYQPLLGLNINISTPELRASKSQKLSTLLQTTGNNMNEEERRIIYSEITLLDEMETLSKKLLEFEPKPDPFAQQMQQLELAKKQAEVKKEEAMAQYYLAMAGKQSSEQDLKDLEFDDKFSGRDIAKEQAIEVNKQKANKDFKQK